MNRRVVAVLVAAAVLAAIAVGYAVVRRAEPSRGAGAGRIDLGVPGQVVFRNLRPGAGYGHLAAVPTGDPGGARTVSAVSCARVHAVRGAGLCLRPWAGAAEGFDAVLLDRRLRETQRVKAAGIPNRARLAPDGRRAAWTAFVTGHSYAGDGFSTQTSILDRRTGHRYTDIETLSITRDRTRVHAPDVNLWGVTFAPGGGFYASMSTGGRTHLVRGDIASWRARTLRTNLECPSLSPDGTRLAFKKRVSSGDRPWRLYVLDLATMTETPLPGTDGIDDQAEWLDANTVLYAMPRDDGGSDVWAAPADGHAPPRRLIRDAASPAVLRA
ncbi:MAG: TolB family protein [Micromonosporaceae bacterium]